MTWEHIESLWSRMRSVRQVRRTRILYDKASVLYPKCNGKTLGGFYQGKMGCQESAAKSGMF